MLVRLYELDLEKWAVPAFMVFATVLALLLANPVKHGLNLLINLIFARRIANRIAGQRKPSPTGPIRVRQTDIVQTMTSTDRVVYERAEQLLAGGKVVEAAALFESIKFQRRAIDELEKSGRIDDACAVLVRLGAFPRVAVLYERNKMYDKSGHWYREAGQFDQSARVWSILARTDYRWHMKAAESWEAAGRFSEALQSWAKILQYDKVLQLATEKKLHDELLTVLRDPTSARNIFPKMTEQQIRELFLEVERSPQSAQTAAFLSTLNVSAWVSTYAATIAAGNPVLTQHFAAIQKFCASENQDNQAAS